MKKVLLICTMMLFGLAVTEVNAQVYATFDNPSSDRGIVREQNISYYEDGGGRGYFVYLPAMSGFTFKVEVPVKWSIRDFHVVDDVAYFCGTDLSGSTASALLGHFNISNLQTGAGLVIFYYDKIIHSKLAILNRIAVYSNMNDKSISLMAIGRENSGINPDMYGSDRVVFTNNYSSAFSYIFRNTINPDELFWDVVLTDGYFVTAGTAGSDTTILTMRREPVGMASFPFSFLDVYHYIGNDTFKSGIRATHIENNDVVMAGYINDDPNSSKFMHLFTIDANSSSMLYHQKHLMPVWPYASGRLLPPREMVYLSDSSALMVIDSNTFPSCTPHSHIVQLTPYPTVGMYGLYIPPYYLYNGSNPLPERYNSLIAISSACCMAASGGDLLKLDLGILSSLTLPYTCMAKYSTDCFREPVYPIVSLNVGEKDSCNKVMDSAKFIPNSVEVHSRCMYSK